MLVVSEIRVTKLKLIFTFCKSPLQFTTIVTLEIYLKLKFKSSDGIILPITAFPSKNRMKKCTGLVIFSR